MGNSAGGGSESTWFSFGQEASTPVVLRLHGARNVGLGPREDICAAIALGVDAMPIANVRSGYSTSFSVAADSVVVLRLAVATGTFAEPGGRMLGWVALPLEHLTRRCGGRLYHTWILLEDQAELRAMLGTHSSEDTAYERFDQNMRQAARDPRMPSVCLSLRPDDPETKDAELYDPSPSSAIKVSHFRGLVHSHAQHARMLQALYRLRRSSDRAGRNPGAAQDPLADSFAPRAYSSQASSAPGKRGSAHSSAGSGAIPELSEAVDAVAADLRQEIESTTAEANARINQASTAIRTLQDRLTARQGELEDVRAETERFNTEAAALEKRNDRAAAEVSALSSPSMSPTRAASGKVLDDEAARVRREIEVLREQKDALLLILDDLYGATKGGPKKERPQQQQQPQHSGPAPPRAADGAASSSDARAADAYGGAQGWTNMLPRPSEIFLRAALDDDDDDV